MKLRTCALILVALVATSWCCEIAAGKSPAPTFSQAQSNSGKKEQKFHPAIFPKLILQTPIADISISLAPEKKRLSTRVSHNESFPPLPKDLQPGSAWDEAKVMNPTAKGENLWHKVPKWITGEFSYGTMVNYLQRNLITGEEIKRDDVSQPLSHGRTRGILVDKAGNYWQKAYGGGINSPNDPKSSEIQHFRFDDQLIGYLISPNVYTENSAGIEFYVSKSTNKIVKVNRWQRIRDFTLKDGNVMVDLSEQKFGLDGKPTLLVKGRGHMIKRAEFAPLLPGEVDGIAGSYSDAVTDLRAFMESIGAIADAPDAAAPTAVTHGHQRLIKEPSPNAGDKPLHREATSGSR